MRQALAEKDSVRVAVTIPEGVDDGKAGSAGDDEAGGGAKKCRTPGCKKDAVKGNHGRCDEHQGKGGGGAAGAAAGARKAEDNGLHGGAATGGGAKESVTRKASGDGGGGAAGAAAGPTPPPGREGERAWDLRGVAPLGASGAREAVKGRELTRVEAVRRPPAEGEGAREERRAGREAGISLADEG
eukprot:gene50581-62232_t